MEYIWAFIIIFAENLLPAFGPPTWLVLVYLTLGFGLEPIPLIAIAVIAASIAHFLMAHAFRKFRFKLPHWYRQNLEHLGDKIVGRSSTSWGLFILFLWSPLSSSQLFVAAGLIPQIRITPLVVAFACGRIVTYTSYVFGATTFAGTDFGKSFISEMTSPFMIISQIVLIGGVVALGFIRWSKKLQEPKQ